MIEMFAAPRNVGAFFLPCRVEADAHKFGGWFYIFQYGTSHALARFDDESERQTAIDMVCLRYGLKPEGT